MLVMLWFPSERAILKAGAPARSPTPLALGCRKRTGLTTDLFRTGKTITSVNTVRIESRSVLLVGVALLADVALRWTTPPYPLFDAKE